MAKIIAINFSEDKGVPKQSIEEGYFIKGHGLEGDAHAGEWHRQVSLLGVESIEKIKKLGLTNLETGSFAENLTTEGICLFELPIGTLVQIGEAIMEVSQIGKECHMGCAIRQTTGDCVMPREGIFAKVIHSGWIRPGDQLEVLHIS
jgi:MOSC domain-containing protein YiiM